MTDQPLPFIPYGRQNITEDDIQAVNEVLRSDFITQGPAIDAFEEDIKRVTKAEHAVACSSATAGLHIAYQALDLGPGDILWTVSNTFVATANAALLLGAEVDFVDISLTSYNMCPVKLRDKLEKAKEADRLPKIVAPVHFGGLSCDMEAIHLLAQEFGFKIVEDASHCIGASQHNKPVGGCKYSDMAVFSFHPVKIITTGEGGVVTTNNAELAEKLKMLRTHGITKDNDKLQYANNYAWYFEQQMLSTNYRMTDIQAALGSSQLKRLDKIVKARHQLAYQYDILLANVRDVKAAPRDVRHQSSWHLYVAHVPPYKRRKVFNHMRKQNIGVAVHYIPVHSHPYYKDLGFKNTGLENTMAYYNGAITLPMFPELTDDDQKRVVDALAQGLMTE